MKLRRFEFEDGVSIGAAVKHCERIGYRVLFMPELIDAVMNNPHDSNFRKYLPYESLTRRQGDTLTKYLCNETLSIKAAGKTRKGSRVILYAHQPTSLSNPKNLCELVEGVLVKGGFPIRQEEFQALVDADGQTDDQGDRLIWVLDYKKLKKFYENVKFSYNAKLENARDHPEAIPFMGGDNRLRKYSRFMKSSRFREIDLPNALPEIDRDSAYGKFLNTSYTCDSILFGEKSLDCLPIWCLATKKEKNAKPE